MLDLGLENVVFSFNKIKLPLIILDEPIRGARNAANYNIFQMDIERKVKGVHRGERFRIYPGSPTNIIQVREACAITKQVLLMVNEPVSVYSDSTKINKRTNVKDAIERMRSLRFFDIRVVGDHIHYKGKTPGGKRYFLMGVDERQLFIAQLTGPATTIEAARKSLGKSVQFAEGTRKFKRQGEWFLLETSEEIRNEIERAIKQTRTAIRKKINIGSVLGRPGGNPHVADELVVLPSGSKDSVGTSEMRLMRNRVFIRGGVRHVDHKTRHFSQWREVIKNDEGATASGTSAGIFWID